MNGLAVDLGDAVRRPRAPALSAENPLLRTVSFQAFPRFLPSSGRVR